MDTDRRWRRALLAFWLGGVLLGAVSVVVVQDWREPDRIVRDGVPLVAPSGSPWRCTVVYSLDPAWLELDACEPTSSTP